MKHRLILDCCLCPLSKKISGWFHPFMTIETNPSQIQPSLSKRRMCKLKSKREDASERCLKSISVSENSCQRFSPALISLSAARHEGH